MRLSYFAALLVMLATSANLRAEDVVIAAGDYHTCSLLQDGTVQCWGENDNGQLGTGMAGGEQPTPQAVPGLSNVIALSAGGYHTCALQQGGTVQCWGYNDDGELGTGMPGGDQSVPQMVFGLSDVIALSAGRYHTCALQQGGAVQCWGSNSDGQLGMGMIGGIQSQPQPVPGLSGVITLSSGAYHTCALQQGGTTQCWGENEDGQLGTGVAGGDQSMPQTVVGLSNAVALSAGGYHTCALQSGGAVQCWGENWDGQLGTGMAGDDQPTPQPVVGLSNAIALSAGSVHTCALQQAGTVQCWGNNYEGELGTGMAGDAQPTPQPVFGLPNAIALSAGRYHTCALQQGGTMQCWGYNFDGELGAGMAGWNAAPQVAAGLSNVVAVTAGGFHTCALHQEGAVHCWGYNSQGQLGTETAGDFQPTPQLAVGLSNVVALSAGRNHSCALQLSGTVQCWGENSEGELGTGMAGSDQSTPQDVAGLSDVIALSAGGNHTCALHSAGTVYCWGDNEDGQLGTGVVGGDQPSPQLVSGLTDVVAIRAGGSHTCALQQGGSVQCWGSNEDGQLGFAGADSSDRVLVPMGGATVLAIAAGGSHSCAAVQGPFPQPTRIVCWGRDDEGQVGNGPASSEDVPSPVPITNATPSWLAAGGDNACFYSLGTAYCWGGNEFGLHGRGVFGSSPAPTNSPGFSTATAMDLGANHACAIQPNKTVICAGDSYFGQLGNGQFGYSATPLVVGRVFANGFEENQ
jgi:alpha-tubulin suppressor-like RCC1 family protein